VTKVVRLVVTVSRPEVGAGSFTGRLRRAVSTLRVVVGPVSTVVAASFVIFTSMSFAPGDPVSQILGQRATEGQREAMRAQLGLDDPILIRYWHWLTDAVHGDFGISLTYRQSVSGLLGPRILTTLTLVVMAALLILIIGVALGSFGGANQRWRPFVNGIVGLGIAIPGFVAASVLISIFAVELGWFPTYGAGSGVLDRVWHLTLPAVALSLGWIAYVAQMTAAAVKEEAGREHVTTATGRGLPRRIVFRRHVMRNAAIPVMTASGLTVAGLVAGSVVIESAFAVDGIGSLLVTSVSNKDYSVVTAISLIIVIVFVVATTVIDIAQSFLDPRLRASKGSS
jgi:peptide/nickel transport system permease protein